MLQTLIDRQHIKEGPWGEILESVTEKEDCGALDALSLRCFLCLCFRRKYPLSHEELSGQYTSTASQIHVRFGIRSGRAVIEFSSKAFNNNDADFKIHSLLLQTSKVQGKSRLCHS
jgi:hypothetical protein